MQRISVEDAYKKMHSTKSYMFIDIRTKEDFEKAHAPNSINLDVEDLKQFHKNYPELEHHHEIYVICYLGNTSKIASMELTRQGWNAFSIDGGFQSWQSHKLPVTYEKKRNQKFASTPAPSINTADSAQIELLGQLCAGIIHEINNPLSILKGSLDILTNKLHKESDNLELQALIENLKLSKAIITMNKAASRIEGIVKSIKRASYVDNSTTPEEINLNDLMAEVEELSRFKALRIPLEIHIDDRCCNFLFYANRNRIIQALLNLVVNAVDEIEARRDRDPWIKLNCKFVDSCFLAFDVMDSGKGIPQELEQKIFQKFYTTKPKGVGTGQGLSIISDIAQQYRGKIYIDHSYANTCFTLALALESISPTYQKNKSA